MSDCGLTSGKLGRFYLELSECPNIRIVDFSANKLDPSGVCHLARIIKAQGEKSGFIPAFQPAREFAQTIATDDAALAQLMAKVGLKLQ